MGMEKDRPRRKMAMVLPWIQREVQLGPRSLEGGGSSVGGEVSLVVVQLLMLPFKGA